MDFLKNVSFSMALFLIGAIFMFLGLSGGFTVSNYSFTIQDIWSRVITSVIGAILVAFAIYLEIKSKLATEKAIAKETGPSLPDTKLKTRAADFFYTLDDSQAEGFPKMVKDAVCIQILGRTAVNLLGQYEKVFEELGKAGCEMRLLFVDPSSETAKFLYGSNPEVYRTNIISASQHLKKLKYVAGHRLQVRITKHAPTVSVVIVEKQDVQQGFIQVQLYFLHSAVGRDRPIFRVNYGDKWHGIFRDEFTQLWSDSIEWDVSHFLETSTKGEG